VGAAPGVGEPAVPGLLRVDVEALRRGGLASDELCKITGVGPVPVRSSSSPWPVAAGVLALGEMPTRDYLDEELERLRSELNKLWARVEESSPASRPSPVEY
jgi:hypothetical protein